jgi:hypothetical protein
MRIHFAIVDDDRGSPRAIAGKSRADLESEIKNGGIMPENFITAGTMDAETGKIDRTHPEIFTDDFVARLVLLYIQFHTNITLAWDRRVGER